MRAGILTFCNAYNLGAALQAHSLQKAMEEIGAEAELIDYRCPAIEKMHRPKPVFCPGIRLKRRLFHLANNAVFFPRRIRYKQFQKKMKRSRIYTRGTIHETNGLYDLFITGSDQVFNFKLTDNDSTYFLDFVEKGGKTSYAASVGTYLPEMKERYQEYLKDFKYLSVRENSTAELFQRELGIGAEVMPDPVFLHSEQEWRKLLGIKEKRKDKYVLVYSLIENKELYEIAKRVAKDQGWKIFVITKVLFPGGKADRFFRNVGPKEFVELISGAEYVVTNSFHGTAFSLIFQKQFVTLLPDAAPDRIIDCLSYVGMSERAVHSAAELPAGSIAYGPCRKQIEALRINGLAYLEKIVYFCRKSI